MQNLFNMDNPLFRFLARLADLIILNLLFLLCCLPIVTIGASLTALYYVTLKMAENEDGYIAKAFFKSFRQNFRQSTVIWLLVLLVGCVLGIDFYILHGAQGTAMTAMRFLIGVSTCFYVMVVLYVFPTLARFYNSIKDTLRNALLMAVADLPRTVAIAAILLAAVLATLINGYTLWYGLLLWVMIGFSLVAYLQSFFLKKVFAKYMTATEDDNSQIP